MLVVSDLDDVFLPKPTDLLVNLAEARASLESLLGRLSEMFQENHTIGSALGPALQAGFKLMVCRYAFGVTTANLTPLIGPHWWEDYGTVSEFAVAWRRSAQEQRGS